jgi:hypothetical protein
MASGASSGTGGSASAEGGPAPAQTHLIQPPSISLPKGGGAIRGLGEKFAANPVKGTSSMSVPIATSPGRGGFGPQLGLSYDSGAGNSPLSLAGAWRCRRSAARPTRACPATATGGPPPRTRMC